MAEEGHQLANHTYSHDYSRIYSDDEIFWADMKKMEDYLDAVVPGGPRLFRFPGGSDNPQPVIQGGGADMMSGLKKGLEEKGYIYFDWNVFPYDTEEPVPAGELAARIREQSVWRKNITLLVHDRDGNTYLPEALDMIIEQLKSDGFCFLPLSENSVPVRF